MFLGGSYHDRDNPANSVEPHHGKLIVWMVALVCNWKNGDNGRAAAGGLRTTVRDDDLMMRMMMMQNIFYGGIGTKCTANKIRNPKHHNNNTNNNYKNNPLTDNKLRQDQHHEDAMLVVAPRRKMPMTTTAKNHKTRSTRIDRCDAKRPPLLQRRPMVDKAPRTSTQEATNQLRTYNKGYRQLPVPRRYRWKPREPAIAGDRTRTAMTMTMTMTMMTPRTLKRMTTRPDLMDEDHAAVSLFEFVGWGVGAPALTNTEAT
jgi:hypothetical protein